MRRVLCCALVATLFYAVPAAAEDDVAADHVAVVSNDGATADVVGICTGAATRSTATVEIVCSVATAGDAVTETCAWSAPRGACSVQRNGVPFPFTVCAEVVAYLRDGTTAADSSCSTYTSAA